MKFLALYPYPRSIDSYSLQGHYLAKGLKALGHDVISCDRKNDNEKEKIYESFKPDFVIGLGCWKNLPEVVLHPQKFGMKAIPWFNANGWVANYHEKLESLPLILVTSNWVKSTYIRDGLSGENIQIAHIGFDPSIFHQQKNYFKVVNVRKKLGIKKEEIMFLTVGGDVTSKGAQEMLRALAKIDKEFPNWKYVLKTLPTFSAYDHGKKEAELIRELNIDPKKIIYIRDDYFPDKVAELMQACDIYAAPSRLEGFGMLHVEAQACGKPVISINVGGPKETIIHGKTGLLARVDHELKLDREWVNESMGFTEKKQIAFTQLKTFEYRADADELANFALKLATDVKFRENLGSAAAKHALQNFHYKKTAQDLLKIIEEVYKSTNLPY